MGSTLKDKIGFWANTLMNIHFTSKREMFLEYEEPFWGEDIDEPTAEAIKDEIRKSLLEIVYGLDIDIKTVNGNRIEYTIKIKEEK